MREWAAGEGNKMIAEVSGSELTGYCMKTGKNVSNTNDKSGCVTELQHTGVHNIEKTRSARSTYNLQ